MPIKPGLEGNCIGQPSIDNSSGQRKVRGNIAKAGLEMMRAQLSNGRPVNEGCLQSDSHSMQYFAI